MVPTLGPFGIFGRIATITPPVAAELEALGFGAIWIAGPPTADLAPIEALLDATETITVATGIVNIWNADPVTVAASYHRITAAHPDRFLLGVGVGHREASADYRQPYQAMVDYLDVLDAEGVPADGRVLAALGPRVLRLAAERSAGAHPYLVPPEHTRRARETLGSGVLLAPEQRVVIEADPARARAIGRPTVAKPYLGLSNYTNNLRRLGFTDADLADGGSDALIEALVAHGDVGAVVARLTEHLVAGADHVAIQLISAPGADPRAEYRALAEAIAAA
jgi:probable F420-dependent oxidoreductase